MQKRQHVLGARPALSTESQEPSREHIHVSPRRDKVPPRPRKRVARAAAPAAERAKRTPEAGWGLKAAPHVRPPLRNIAEHEARANPSVRILRRHRVYMSLHESTCTCMTRRSTLCSSKVIPLAGPARKLQAPFSAVLLPRTALSFIRGGTGGTGCRCCTNPTTGRFPVLGTRPLQTPLPEYTNMIRSSSSEQEPAVQALARCGEMQSRGDPRKCCSPWRVASVRNERPPKERDSATSFPQLPMGRTRLITAGLEPEV